MTEQLSLSPDALRMRAHLKLQAHLAELPGQGWARLIPPKDGVAYMRDGKYLNSLGEPMEAPEGEKPDYRQNALDSVSEKAGAMSNAELARLQIQLEGGQMSDSAVQLGLSDDKAFFEQFTDEDIKIYLDSKQVDYGDASRETLLTMASEVATPYTKPIERKTNKKTAKKKTSKSK